MPPAKKKFTLLEFTLIFLLIFIATDFLFDRFFPTEGENGNGGVEVITLKPIDATIKGGHHPQITLRNGSAEPLSLDDRCPLPPLDVYEADDPGEPDEELKLINSEETVIDCKAVGVIEPGEKMMIDLGPWKYSVFNKYGTYEVRIPGGIDTTGHIAIEDEHDAVATRFSIHEAGSITKLFRAFITKPLLNFLVLIASYLPDYSLGWAIVIVTILVKILLYFPTQHALEGQKKLQAIQPQLDALKQKYKGDPKKLQEKTMEIWKREKINPMQSCLPMLIQLPILLGLFFVIRDGSVLALSREWLYAPYLDLPWDFGTMFYGLDLTIPSIYLFPPLLVVLQFIQMKLTFAIAKKKQDGQKKPEGDKARAQQMQQTMMTYFLPLLIGFFALKFPAAVSLYWGVSTIFAIGQQIVVNRKTLV